MCIYVWYGEPTYPVNIGYAVVAHVTVTKPTPVIRIVLYHSTVLCTYPPPLQYNEYYKNNKMVCITGSCSTLYMPTCLHAYMPTYIPSFIHILAALGSLVY